MSSMQTAWKDDPNKQNGYVGRTDYCSITVVAPFADLCTLISFCNRLSALLWRDVRFEDSANQDNDGLGGLKRNYIYNRFTKLSADGICIIAILISFYAMAQTVHGNSFFLCSFGSDPKYKLLFAQNVSSMAVANIYPVRLLE